MMDAIALREKMNDLSRAMLGKGLRNPTAQVMIEAHVAPLVYLHWDDEAYAYGKTEVIRDPSIEQAIEDAFALVRQLPTAEEAKRQQFMTSLAKVIDLGRENGIEVDFLNPLTETMKRISENAITYQPHLAAADFNDDIVDAPAA